MSQESAEIHIVEDKEGVQFFPVTHTDAVINDDGDLLTTLLSGKQATLESGVNIKTINSQSLLGSGNIVIEGGGGGGGSIDSIVMNGNAVTVTSGVADLGTVVTSVSDKAPLASPALTGTPTAPTAASGTNSTQIATTAFVQSAVSPTENAKSITYSDLKTARTNGTLVPGTWYRITDYVATTTDTESRSASHPFDILVMAESATTLSEEGYAALHSGDTYFSSNNLSAWKVWYCLDNDTTRFAWADSTNGKGVVYRMIDEFNNDLPFDFKGIQFKRYKITDIDIKSSGVVNPTAAIYIGVYAGLSVTANKFSVDSTDYKWFYPFTFLGSTWSSSISDASIGTECLSSQNTLLPVTSGKLQSLNNVVFARGSVLAGNAIESPYEAVAAIHNCEFGKGATHLSIFGHAANNVMRSQFRKSIILGHFRHNTFNSDVQNNEFCSQEDFSFNEMSDYCEGNSIIVGSGTVFGNRIASYFNSNVIVCSDFSYNTTSSIFTRNTILGTNVQGNTFGVVYDSSFSGLLRFSLTSGYMKNCSFSYVTGCQMLGNIQYVTAEAGTSSNYFSGIVIKGPLNGASNAVIKLENSNFLLGSSATIGRSVVIESNPDGEIVATWRDADGKETGIIATAAGSRSNTWNALPSPAGGTVTSVAMTVPTGFSVSGTPVTSSGTLAVTLDSQAKNKVLASPTNASGTPSFRALDASDIPDLSGTYKTTDANVTQTATTTNSNYEVLFSGSANNTTTTEGARKTSTLTYNPSTKALSTGGAVNGLTLTAATTGFTIAGGTTSKTLTVNNSYTLGAACAKAVTDNSSNADVTSSDTNLITGRTLYYQLAKKNYSTTSPGTLNTNNSTAQTASASEALSGSISLHKVAKTGTYSDLIGTPSSLPASDVSAWAKESTKPSYTLDEVTDGTTRSLANFLRRDGGSDMTANGAISWGNNDRTDWNTFVTGIRVMSSTSATSGAPVQYSTGINIKARYGFQIAMHATQDRFFIRRENQSWMEFKHSGNAEDASDVRLKEDIETMGIEEARRIVLSARPVTFRWKEGAANLDKKYSGEDIGLIAQEVEEYFPKGVGSYQSEYLSVDYKKFVAPLLAVVQEQQKQIDELNDKLNAIMEMLK